MDRINEYKQVEENQQQGKGKAKVVPQDWKDFKLDRYNNNWPQKDFAGILAQLLLKWSALYSENPCTRF